MKLLYFIPLVFFIGCFPFEAPLPPDFPVIHTDTISTLPESDTCTELVSITEPKFVTAYHQITDPFSGPRIIIIGNNSDTLQGTPEEMEKLIDSLFELYHPELSYTVYVGADDRNISVLAKGTNDREQFYLNAQIRYNGWKHYFGFTTRGMIFMGAATEEEFYDAVLSFPSFNEIDWYNTQFSDAGYIKTAEAGLANCKKGEWRAHFGLQHPYVFPDSIPQKYEDADWQTVLHAPSYLKPIIVKDLKDLKNYNGQQVIVKQ